MPSNYGIVYNHHVVTMFISHETQIISVIMTKKVTTTLPDSQIDFIRDNHLSVGKILQYSINNLMIEKSHLRQENKIPVTNEVTT